MKNLTAPKSIAVALKVFSATLLLSTTFAFAGEVEVDVPATIEVQGKKVFWNEETDVNGDNLEQWWGRGNIQVITKADDFEGKFHLRVYPADFTATPILSTRLQDTTIYRLRNSIMTPVDTSIQKTDTITTTRVELWEAYALQKFNMVDIKFGRWVFDDRAGSYFGNYTDKGPTGFLLTSIGSDAAQISIHPYESIQFDLALISEDNHLNKGSFRGYLHLSNLSGIEKLKIGIGYRNNMFDAVKDPDADVTHNASAKVELPFGKNFRVFTEVGFTDLDKEDATTGQILDPNKNVIGGLEVPGGKALDKVLFETEYNPDRNEVLLGSVLIQKNLSERFKLYGGLHSHAQTADWAVSVRLQSIIN